MNREIKFRVWDTIYKEMIEWKPHIGESIMTDYINNPTKQFIVMQYTGLKDKEGQEIYEGDVVEWNFHNNKVRGLVIFDDGCFLVDFSLEKAKKRIPLYEYTKQNIKVIGNKFEHTETILLHAKLFGGRK